MAKADAGDAAERELLMRLEVILPEREMRPRLPRVGEHLGNEG